MLLFEAGSRISHGIDKLLNTVFPFLVVADLLFAKALEFRELLLRADIIARIFFQAEDGIRDHSR